MQRLKLTTLVKNTKYRAVTHINRLNHTAINPATKVSQYYKNQNADDIHFSYLTFQLSEISLAVVICVSHTFWYHTLSSQIKSIISIIPA